MVHSFKHLLALLSFSILFFTPLYAQPDIDFELVASGFDKPVDITNAGDGTNRLFVVEREGFIRIIELNNSNNVLATPFLDINTLVDHSGGEQGLLGLAFHPDFSTNGYFYVNYTRDPGPGLDRTVIARYSINDGNPDVADPASAFTILEIEQDFGNHNGGDLNFGPDGYLYIAMGDGGDGGDPNCRSQDMTQLLGKMLRIDVDGTAPAPASSNLCGLVTNYGIPGDNPFTGVTAECNEIWASGLRNPWRVSFDSQTGDLWIADVGQNNREEINVEPSGTSGGTNYGWKIMEGNFCHDPDPIDTDCPAATASCFDSGYTAPIFEYNHGLGCSVTGGFVYRGTQHPNMIGLYLLMDYCSNRLWTIEPDTPPNWIVSGPFVMGVSNVTTFGEDENNELYIGHNSSNASIYKVIDNLTPMPVELISFTGKHENKNNLLEWTTGRFENFSHFEIERSLDARRFQKITTIDPDTETLEKGVFNYVDQPVANQDHYYRLKMIDRDQTYRYSKMVHIPIFKNDLVHIFPNPTKGILNINRMDNNLLSGYIELYDIYGKQLLREEIESNNTKVDISEFAKGTYMMIVEVNGQKIKEMIVLD